MFRLDLKRQPLYEMAWMRGFRRIILFRKAILHYIFKIDLYIRANFFADWTWQNIAILIKLFIICCIFRCCICELLPFCLVFVDIVMANAKSFSATEWFAFFGSTFLKGIIDHIFGRFPIVTEARISPYLREGFGDVILGWLKLILLFFIEGFTITKIEVRCCLRIDLFFPIDAKITIDLRIIQRVAVID
jgi:hypothetical protein